jgi:hypothetical protein
MIIWAKKKGEGWPNRDPDVTVHKGKRQDSLAKQKIFFEKQMIGLSRRQMISFMAE